MKLIVGLGNPGPEYAGTRHNAGRRVLESIALRQSLAFSRKKSLKVLLASFEWQKGRGEILLAIPDSFMNESGPAVLSLVEKFKIPPQKDLLIVVDDAALPLGKIRLRAKGSDGGHKGLKSIEQALGTQGYARLRIGISSPVSNLRDYVLEGFSREEEKELNRIFEKACEACRFWSTQPIDKAMGSVNPD